MHLESEEATRAGDPPRPSPNDGAADVDADSSTDTDAGAVAIAKAIALSREEHEEEQTTAAMRADEAYARLLARGSDDGSWTGGGRGGRDAGLDIDAQLAAAATLGSTSRPPPMQLAREMGGGRDGPGGCGSRCRVV